MGGLFLGLLVTVAAAHQPVTAVPTSLGTDVLVTAAPTGELDVAPRGALLSVKRLPPGRPAIGRASVRNQTGVTLSVTALVGSSSAAADRLNLRVQAGSETVADGSADRLATGSRPWLLESGHEVDVIVEAWVPAVGGYAADAVHVDIRFETQRAGS